MAGLGGDTDLMLAMLSSLVHPLMFSQNALLDSLVESDGDIEAAAASLRKESEPPKKKRKISSGKGLDGWLKSSQAPRAAEKVRVSSKPLSSRDGQTPSTSYGAKSEKSKSSIITGVDQTAPSSSSPKKPVSHVKTVTNTEFLSLFRPPNSSDSTPKGPPRYPPLTLISPEHVAAHTPCTLHNSILPQDLACRLFWTMIYLSRDWKKNKWWLFDKVVESPHRTSFYVRRNPGKLSAPQEETSEMEQAASDWYTGRQIEGPPPSFPGPMEEACEIIERVVNAEMKKRQRFPLEWAGDPTADADGRVIWRANVAASNCYEGGKESVGFHSDQMTHLGPYPTIASLSLGVSRTFRLREVVPVDEKDSRSARTFNIPLRHNSLVIMHASTQETFKHSIPPQNTIDIFHPPFPPPPELAEADDSEHPLPNASNARINITFRFYRPDYRASTTPRCRCGVPCILRPDMKNRYEEYVPQKDATDAIDTSPGESSKLKDPEPGAAQKKRLVAKYWWTCYAGAQNDGKGCGMWKVMDVVAEGRGPFVGDVQ